MLAGSWIVRVAKIISSAYPVVDETAEELQVKDCLEKMDAEQELKLVGTTLLPPQ